MQKIFYMLCLLFLYGSLSYAQDTASKISQITYDFNLSGGVLYHSASSQYIILPSWDKDPYSSDIHKEFRREGRITDNPLFHGVGFIEFDAIAKAYGAKLDAGIVAEHRGYSYGVYDTKNMIVFPRILMSFDTGFTVFDEKFSVGFATGTFRHKQLYEGLNFYNIDWQGNNIYIKWKNLKFEYNKIGDLYRNIGLNINDVNDWNFSLEDINIYKDYNITARAGLSHLLNMGFNYFLFEYEPDIFLYNLSLSIKNDHLKLYAQANTYASNYSKSTFLQHSALLTGASTHYEFRKFKFNSKIEYRYYGFYYNSGFRDNDVYYREKTGNGNAEIGNTIGPELYPLDNYLYPFSQWAAYTEIQNQCVQSVIFQFNGRYYLIDKVMLDLGLDLNYIRTCYETPFLYPFYNIGAGFEIMNDAYFTVGYTNKAMNLDKTYRTFYLYKYPTFQLAFLWNVKL